MLMKARTQQVLPCIAFLSMFLITSAMAQEMTLGVFTHHTDVGKTKTVGTTA